MIRFINCIYRHPDISIEEFRRHWSHPKFASLVEEMEHGCNARDSRHSLVLNIDLTTWVNQLRGAINEPPDGVIEYWWDKGAGLEKMLDQPESAALLSKMHNYQEEFIDLNRSFGFFIEG